jgi:hypothetical protein
VDVDGRVRFLDCLQDCRIRVPDMGDIIVQVKERLGIVGCEVITERGLFYFERLAERVVQRGRKVLDSLLED